LYLAHIGSRSPIMFIFKLDSKLNTIWKRQFNIDITNDKMTLFGARYLLDNFYLYDYVCKDFSTNYSYHTKTIPYLSKFGKGSDFVRLNEMGKFPKVHLSPNPTKDFVYFTGDITQYYTFYVIDISGR